MSVERKDERLPVNFKVRYRSATFDAFVEEHSNDLSRGGIFLRSDEPLNVGALVKLELHLADDSPEVTGVGRVAWVRRPADSDAKHPPGMGVKFVRLDAQGHSLLDRALGKLTPDKPRDVQAMEHADMDEKPADSAPVVTMSRPRPSAASAELDAPYGSLSPKASSNARSDDRLTPIKDLGSPEGMDANQAARSIPRAPGVPSVEHMLRGLAREPYGEATSPRSPLPPKGLFSQAPAGDSKAPGRYGAVIAQPASGRSRTQPPSPAVPGASAKGQSSGAAPERSKHPTPPRAESEPSLQPLPPSVPHFGKLPEPDDMESAPTTRRMTPQSDALTRAIKAGMGIDDDADFDQKATQEVHKDQLKDAALQLAADENSTQVDLKALAQAHAAASGKTPPKAGQAKAAHAGPTAAGPKEGAAKDSDKGPAKATAAKSSSSTPESAAAGTAKSAAAGTAKSTAANTAASKSGNTSGKAAAHSDAEPASKATDRSSEVSVDRYTTSASKRLLIPSLVLVALVLASIAMVFWGQTFIDDARVAETRDLAEPAPETAPELDGEAAHEAVDAVAPTAAIEAEADAEPEDDAALADDEAGEPAPPVYDPSKLEADGPKQQLVLATQPSRAKVFIEGVQIGSAPLRKALPVGVSLKLRIEAEGYQTISRELRLDPHARMRLDVELPPLEYVLAVETVPPGAEVKAAGQTITSPGELRLSRVRGPVVVYARLPHHHKARLVLPPEGFVVDGSTARYDLNIQLKPRDYAAIAREQELQRLKAEAARAQQTQATRSAAGAVDATGERQPSQKSPTEQQAQPAAQPTAQPTPQPEAAPDAAPSSADAAPEPASAGDETADESS